MDSLLPHLEFGSWRGFQDQDSQPSTYVQGDFWSGHTAWHAGRPHIIDWTWTTWSLGGSALLDLLAQPPELAAPPGIAGGAYARGRGRPVGVERQRACADIAPALNILRQVAVCTLVPSVEPPWLPPAVDALERARSKADPGS